MLLHVLVTLMLLYFCTVFMLHVLTQHLITDVILSDHIVSTSRIQDGAGFSLMGLTSIIVLVHAV